MTIEVANSVHHYCATVSYYDNVGAPSSSGIVSDLTEEAQHRKSLLLTRASLSTLDEFLHMDVEVVVGPNVVVKWQCRLTSISPPRPGRCLGKQLKAQLN